MGKPSRRALTLVTSSEREEIDANLSDLPAELLSELSTAHLDVLERQMLAVLEALGGSGDLDQILIGLYRKFGVVQKRRFTQNKLWRMVRKGQIKKPKAARGLFRLDTPRPPRRERRK